MIKISLKKHTRAWIVGVAIGVSAFALATTEDPPLPIVMLDQQPGLSCPTGFLMKSDTGRFVEKIRDLDLSPSCIWNTITNDAQAHSGSVRGFAFGNGGSIGEGAEIEFATEFVVMRADAHHLMAAYVKNRGVGASLSLPAGVGLSQSVIFGTCERGIPDYLGWFEGESLVAKTLFQGRESMVPFNRKLTGCNALESTRGLNSMIGGLNVVYATPFTDSVLLAGPRAQELIDYIDAVNGVDPSEQN